MQSNFVIHNNTKLNYFTCGDGAPLLLMHGFAEDHTIWKNQIEFLSRNFSIIVPDLFGTGNSDFLEVDDIQISDYAKGIKSIIANEKIDKFSMMGHSMGGYITLAYLELFPDDLVSAGLIHSTAFADDDLKLSFRKKAISFIKHYGSGAFVKTSIPGLFSDPEKHQSKIQEMIENAGKTNPEVLIQYYQAIMNRKDSCAILTDTSIPILFISGKNDNVLPVKQNLQQCHLPDISSIFILKNSGHMGIIEEADSVNKILHFFLSDISNFNVL